MKCTLTYMLLLVLLPAVAIAQSGFSGRKSVFVHGSRLDVYGQGVCFGQNPVFLVPVDTFGNVSCTGMINGVKVMGKFAPISGNYNDTTAVEDPLTGEIVELVDSNFSARKQGEWVYYYGEGNTYREYYDTGKLIKTDTLYGVFKVGNREIKIADSMARVKSILGLYLRRGTRLN